MIYDIRQTTTYDYASKVAYAHHVLRLTPIDRPRQRVHAAALEIDPVPVERREGFDFFGNHVTWIGLDEPHDTLTIKVAARVAVEAPAEPVPRATPPWEEVRADVMMTSDIGATSPAHFLFPSRQVSLDPEIRDYAAEELCSRTADLDGAIDLMRRIKADFAYEIGATTVSTTPPMSFALRRGVCQDFAHIMISGLRGLGLPAAYVSGYLRTVPPPGKPRLEGADAMHAWVLVWCGTDAGWCGFDPTNAILVGDDHVALAIGRDYSDVAPIAGVVFASGEQQLEVAVDVIPVKEPACASGVGRVGARFVGRPVPATRAALRRQAPSPPFSSTNRMISSTPWPVRRLLNTNGRAPRMRLASRSITSSEAPTWGARSILLMTRRSERVMPGPPLDGILSPAATSIT